MTKQIPLTRGKFAQVDDEDYERLIYHDWQYTSKGYASCEIVEDGKVRRRFMHRIIMDAPPHLEVDHINRDRLDNRRQNLRFATHSQNQANKGIQKNNTSGYKGVNWRAGAWDVRIRHNGNRLNLGRYDHPGVAAIIYDGAARYIFGEFANVNFPTCPTPIQVTQFVQYTLEYGRD